ncbi:hypothetical protein CEUSTIGMA_g11693.t1 [Chlamydomonas eustigma]|uniref:Uncharacterized protein n=1 Tax=Chlamydomonas eustigma TaxID=1157962 RepID=A0A250XN85_9CHLO|nr:hypothetical protein CEUSTIGMA_g11693.t1 [Chlamydomonas eustigma]|eukprot:GAX84270.1 hypothetical protein CEUSTIGMA_g11693.t1 [Chlamydomonas eustigma]
MVLCGAQPVYYTYPAWTFGGPHSRVADGDVIGPGPGDAAAYSTMGSAGPVFGPSTRGLAKSGEPYGDGLLTAYKRPGYLSQEPRQPAYSFGSPYKNNFNSNPGPAAYDASRSLMTAPTSSWGPPPRAARPATAPRTIREERPHPKAKGPSFGLPHQKLRQDPTPGPQDYSYCCGGTCCKACDTYSGATLKGRKPMFYGKVTTVTPGPAAYHTECSTIGVATAACSSGPPKVGKGTHGRTAAVATRTTVRSQRH